MAAEALSMARSAKNLFLFVACVFGLASCSDAAGPGSDPGGGKNPGSDEPPPVPGQTDFTTEEAGAGGSGGRGAPETGVPGAAPAPPTSGQGTDGRLADPSPPAGRVGEVEEADIYKVDQNRLFYLNTYRGFIIYDVNDPKNPRRVSRLPVYGYPIEMFISGNTVYALLKDALYLTQTGDRLQFERHNVSQLVVIDIADLANPKVVQTIDIRGQLREGVSRKIDNTIYVVSYFPRTYYWGWRPDPDQMTEQAWVYSFNVANPRQVTKAGELKIFEGGSKAVSDPQGSYHYDQSFSSVAISATANALMVVENWNISAYTTGGTGGSRGSFGCGSYNSTQLAKVSLIDISDPAGTIELHARFETPGALGDQFKMTYDSDPLARTGTFYGIFARQVWSSNGCEGSFYTQNVLESWDVSVRGSPRRLDELAFGKANELVRGSAFDTERKVAYAITAQRIDPMYALGFADRTDLRKLSEIDGLSGEMSVFRLVGDKKFLLAVGQDASLSCTGFQDTQGWQPTKIAVSLIDVQDLTKIRLVQRQCVAVKNADWIGSDVTGNLDQAHKLLGMHSDGDVNVITVPVYYSRRLGSSSDWWSGYRLETAVGLMTWDLKKYVTTLPPEEQAVIENFGTFVHPHGEVRRSIVFTHQGATPRRMMINLSDTHVSVADLTDMRNPIMQSEIEVAPFYNQIYRFGDYLVEQVQAKPSAWGNPGEDVVTFRVKRAGGNLDDGLAIASIDVGRVYRVLKHTSSLLLFRQIDEGRIDQRGLWIPPTTEAVVLDLADPTHPRLAGRVTVPLLQVPHYRFWCGMDAYFGGFWFDQVNNFAMTERGIAFQVSEWHYENDRSWTVNKLVFLDLRNPDAPGVSEQGLPDGAAYEWGTFGVVADPVAPNGFYVSYRKKVGEITTPEQVVYSRYKYYAQRWEPEGDSPTAPWVARADINTPGRLIRTWRSGSGARMFLSQDSSYRKVTEGESTTWFSDYRLSLLKEQVVNGKPAAELLDSRVLTDLSPGGLILEGDKLLLNGRPGTNAFWGQGGRGGAVPPSPPSIGVARPAIGALQNDGNASPLPGWESTSDRLMIFDLASGKLDPVFDQPTRMYNTQLMGTHQGRLFINLGGNQGYYDPFGSGGGGGGDGILVVDISNPSAPHGVKFLRTLGFATHIEFFADDVYVAAGHFGLFHLDLGSAAEIPIETIQ
jgi:hypothetical protein